ncbi:MAG: hypothetical protein IPL23_07215 [Saprospiraceae bacterium]|nr:hypothetical protein [Saprospiraceae bacterium]
MKNILPFSGLLLLTFLLSACLRDECTSTTNYIQLDPVYTTVEAFRKNEIVTIQNVPLENPGKIYLYKNYLLINEAGRGIHFYDISDPKKPAHKVYYEILGNFDMAINNDLLVVDNVIDLVSINISDILNPKVQNRHNNYKNVYDANNYQHVAYYNKTNVVRSFDCSVAGPTNVVINWGGNFWALQDATSFSNTNVLSSGQVKSSTNGSVGVGGSTARFSLAKNQLYTLTDVELSTWNLSTLEKVNITNLGWGMETLFAAGDNLYVGSTTGMTILDISNGQSPVKLSTFTHATSCDPVVVNGNYAYVTLRSGNACNGNLNQLDIINITNKSNPTLVKTYAMTNPHGLSFLNNKLYICEGDFGFKVLDVSDANDVKQLNFDKKIKAQDVIALNEKEVMVIGSDGFYFLDVNDPKKIKIEGSILKN